MKTFIEYIGFDFSAAEGDDVWRHGEYPDFDKDILPLLLRYTGSIDRIILISNSHMDIDKGKLVKITDRLSIDHKVIEIPGSDIANKRLTEFIRFYGDHNGELNLFIQSHDMILLRAFYDLFPEPFRKHIEFSNNLGRKPQDIEDVRKIVEQLDEKTYMISSALEGCMHCVFAHKELRNSVKSWC